MSQFQTLWALDFFRNAFYAGLLASVLCGVVGTLIVLQRLVSISGGVSHAAFGGLGLAHWLGADPRSGALCAAVTSAWILGALERHGRRLQDAVIGVLWAVGMAIGVVFLHLTPGYPPNLMGYLFGDILLVSSTELWLAALADLTVLTILVFFWREIVAVAFDEQEARLQGLPVRFFSFLLLTLVAISVVVILQLVGIVLVIALITIPPLISLRLWRGLPMAILGSVLIGFVITTLGLILSFQLGLPSGPTMVLLGTALLLLALLRRPRPLRRPNGQTLAEDG
jgi:zinc transport system permease protein